MISGAAAFAVGVMTAAQSRANGTLATVFDSAIDASIWSFVSGWILLTLAMLHPAVRGGLARARRAHWAGHIAWWQFFGGLGGGFFVAAQTWSVPQIGVALFTIALVGGQTANALVVDRAGLGPAGRAPVSAIRVLAALGTFVGVAVAMFGRDDAAGVTLSVTAVVVAIAAGAGLAVQQAINGRVNQQTGNVLATTWINFTWGFGLLIGILLAEIVRGTWAPPVSLAAPWWAWLGGVMGIVFVAVGAVVVHHLGVLLATLLTLAGQLSGAVLVDALSAAGAAHVDLTVLAGVAITLASAMLAARAGQRARRRAFTAGSPGRR